MRNRGTLILAGLIIAMGVVIWATDEERDVGRDVGAQELVQLFHESGLTGSKRFSSIRDSDLEHFDVVSCDAYMFDLPDEVGTSTVIRCES